MFRPSFCLSITAVFLTPFRHPFFFCFFLIGVPLDGGDEEQRSGTVLLEDLDFNENKKKKSRTRSSRLLEDVCTKKRRFEGKIVQGRVGVRFRA